MAGVESDGSGKVQPRRNKTKRLMLRTVVIVVIAVASFISSIRTTVSSYSKDDASFHVQSSASQQRSNKCTPRTYPFPSRYYGLTSPDYPPKFLHDAAYLRGEYPNIILDDSKHRQKFCRKVEDYSPDNNETTMDGTNPSILALERLDSVTLKGYPELMQEILPFAAFLVSLTFKNNHQCDLSKQQSSYMPQLPGRQRKKEVDVLLVDSDMGTLLHTTIMDEASSLPVPMDDAKLFLHADSLWISYTRHDSQNRGMQLFSRLKVEYSGHRLSSSIVEPTISVCCGRNMAAFETVFDRDEMSSPIAADGKNHTLQLLAWLDPLFVGSVDTSQLVSGDRVHLFEPDEDAKMMGDSSLRLHGTTGSLLFLPKLKEYIGIGHYHRESSNGSSQESLYGHHYTHVFFTISAPLHSAPFHLKRVSNEFVLESFGRKGDADVVQFASGLELIQSDGVDFFLIAYGINDCEAATASIPAETVYGMLQPVPDGTAIHEMMKSHT